MGVLALDLGARNLGWACDRQGANRPSFDLVKLPGTAHLGKLYVAVRNILDRIVDSHDPARICYVPKFSTQGRTAVRTAEALGGVQAWIDGLACDWEMPEPTRYNERTVRKAVLGRCDFGKKDAHGRIIADSGRQEAKDAVLDWCAFQGYDLTNLSHDTGDALVLWHYDQMQTQGRRAPRTSLALR